MPNFCTKCGRPLAEGEVCNCQNPAPAQGIPQPQQGMPAQGIPQPQQGQPVQGIPQPQQGQPVQGIQQPQQGMPVQGIPQPQQGMPVQGIPQPQQGMPQGVPYSGIPYGTQQPSAAGDFFKKFGNTFINVFKTPVTGGKNFVESADFMVAGLFILIQAFLVAVYGVVFEAKLGTYIKLLSYWYSDIKMPYVKVFFGTFGLSIVFSAALAGLLLAANLIFRNKLNYQKTLCLTALRSIVIAPVIILAMVVTLINPIAGVVVFFSGNIWAVIYTTLCTPENTNKKLAEFVPLYMFLVYFIFMIVCLVIMRVASGLYVPSVFDDITSLLGGSSFFY